VIVETEAMVAGHRHFPFGRCKEKHISMFDDNGFGNAVRHGQDSLSQNVFVATSGE
jgi:hypothetical protein